MANKGQRQGLLLIAEAKSCFPLSRDGVSRLSAYHRFGMISPFLVARELAHNPSNGARKLLDEFLTWRELAYIWCFHHLPTTNLFAVRSLPIAPTPFPHSPSSTQRRVQHWCSARADMGRVCLGRGVRGCGQRGGQESVLDSVVLDPLFCMHFAST